MTRDELRAGIIRLVLVVLIVFAVPVVVALVVWVASGGSYTRHLAFVMSVAALLPLLAGVGIFMTSRPMARERGPQRGPAEIRRRSREELRSRELLAGGLALLGTAMFAVDLLLR
jgi:hypothetical protein